VAAKGFNHIRVLGYQPSEVLRDCFSRSEAFVFAAEEDFGIAPLEAQASGTPVIAFGKGGVRETVLDGVTGVFFERQNVESIQAAVRRFRSLPKMDLHVCRQNAERFAPNIFRNAFQRFVTDAWTEHCAYSQGNCHIEGMPC
jgi:glycosyltransferase involved in cell wall biosynthesis